jgi:hypothetical protein
MFWVFNIRRTLRFMPRGCQRVAGPSARHLIVPFDARRGKRVVARGIVGLLIGLRISASTTICRSSGRGTGSASTPTQFFFDPAFSRRDAYAFGLQTVVIF